MSYKLLLKLQGLVMVGVLTVSFGVAWVFFLLAGLPRTPAAVLASVVVVAVAWYLFGARNNARKYWDIKGWKWSIRIDRDQCKIPAKAFDRVRYVFDEIVDSEGQVVFRENRVRRVWREHLYSTVRVVWWAILLAGICLVLSMQAILMSPDPALPWWVFGLLAAIFMVIAESRSWPWRYRYYIVTDLRVIRVIAPPPLLAPFMPGQVRDVDLRKLVTAKQIATSLGDALGYGEVGLDTEADVGDKEFNSIPYTPEYVLVAQIIKKAKLYAQLMIPSVPGHDPRLGAPSRPAPPRPSNAGKGSARRLASLKRRAHRKGAKT